MEWLSPPLPFLLRDMSCYTQRYGARFLPKTDICFLTRNGSVFPLYAPCQRAGRPRSRACRGNEESPGSMEPRCRVTPGGSRESGGQG